jgi:hypothetical protein
MRQRAWARSGLVVLLFWFVSPPIVDGQSGTREELFTFEIPELGVRLKEGASVALPGGNPGHIQIRIGLQPTQVSYGNVFSRINTESANVVMTLTGTTSGVLCDFDLSRRPGFRLRNGRNSVEIGVQDNRGRLRYTSFLIELSGAATEATKSLPPISVPKGERYALVVGVSRYRAATIGLRNLATPDRDASGVRDFLMSPAGGSYGADHIELLLDEDATVQRVRQALASVARRATANDMVVVYLSGYAVSDVEDPRRSYLLVHDSNPNELGESAVAFSDIEDFYGRTLKAGTVVTFLDVARNAPFMRAASPTNTLVHQYLMRFAGGDGRAVLAAADVGQTSWETQEPGADGRGVFVRALVDGLRGAADPNRDGTVTFGELATFVRDQVRKSTGGQQSPVGTSGPGESIALAGLRVR